LLEPALVFKVPAGATMGERGEMRTKYYKGDKAGAISEFMEMVDGPGWRKSVEAVPGAMDLTVKDADTFFQTEGGALLEWTFGAEDAARIKQPVLAVAGADTEPVFRESFELILKWFPHARAATIPHVTHMLMMRKPREVAEVMAAFLRDHPMS
jgi:pimeloyl-ACP methyl ester carboxylesterase